MYFDKDLNVNIDTNLSIKSTIVGSNLSVSQLDFDRLGKDVEVQGENIHGTVPSASNIYANRIMSDTDASFYNLSMIKLDLTHGELERKNRVLEFATNMSYQPSENLLSVGKLASDDGYQVSRLNAGALSTTSPVDLNPDINITQQNLQKTDANLSVAFSGESTLTNTISVAEPNNTDGFAQKLVFANVEPESSGSLTVRPDVTYEVDGDDYGLKINTTKILNNYVSTNELYATNLNIGTSSNDPLHVTKDGAINAREVSSARLIIQESSAFSGTGTSGELKYAGGKFYGHDGTKFMTISSSTANDDETGMFVTEGKNDINFMSASNGTPFDMQIQSNLVKIPDALSVKNIHVYDETNVRSLILKNSVRLKKYPEVDLIENDNSASSGYVANGSSTLSDQNDFFKCFDGKDTSYDDFGDGTGHYSAWISQTTYDHTTGLPLQDVSPTFPGTDRKGEYCTLKLPTPILLKEIHVFTRGSADFENAAPPKDIRLYATNNGVDWTELGVYKDLIFAGREGLRLEAGKMEGTTTITQKFDQFAVQVECTTVQGNKPAYCAIGRIDFYTEDETATYTDLDGRLEGVPGQLIYSDGKVLCHDGYSFKSITGSTANLDRTGMFLIEGEPHIKFRANSDSNATEFFDVKIDEQKTEFNSNVRVRADLSVGGATTFSGHLIPSVAESFDIGSTELTVRDLFVSDNSIWVGDSAKILFANGKLKFRRRKLNVVPAAILTAGSDAGHPDHDFTKNEALTHAGVTSITEMKLGHWARYMKTLRPEATLGDIFRRDHDEDYEATASSEVWYEIDDSKVYTDMAIGIQTNDPREALHVNGKIRVEDGFSLVKKGSVENPNDPALVIDTNYFGTDTQVVDRTTSAGITSFTKLFRIFGRTSGGIGRSWHWGLPNDDSTKLGLAWDGGGDPDPDVGFVFTTNAEMLCAKVHAESFIGNASTATKLAASVDINGVSFDGSQSVLIHEVSSDDPTTTPLKKVSANGLTDSYNFILHGPLPAETEGGATHFINGAARTEDGGQSTYTIRNDSGDLRLGRTSSKTRIEGNVEFENPPSAPKLTTAVNINGVPFDGSQDISITAPKLTTPVNINGVPFDGSKDIIIEAGSAGGSSMNFSAKDLDALTVAVGNDYNHRIEKTTGDYGTITVQGQRGNYAGYSIRNQWVFMGHTNATYCGIYNDLDSHWAVRNDRNSHTRLYYNGSEKFRTENDGVYVEGNLKLGYQKYADITDIRGDSKTYVQYKWVSMLNNLWRRLVGNRFTGHLIFVPNSNDHAAMTVTVLENSNHVDGLIRNKENITNYYYDNGWPTLATRFNGGYFEVSGMNMHRYQYYRVIIIGVALGES